MVSKKVKHLVAQANPLCLKIFFACQLLSPCLNEHPIRRMNMISATSGDGGFLLGKAGKQPPMALKPEVGATENRDQSYRGQRTESTAGLNNIAAGRSCLLDLARVGGFHRPRWCCVLQITYKSWVSPEDAGVQ